LCATEASPPPPPSSASRRVSISSTTKKNDGPGFADDETAPARTRARVAQVLERAAGLLARACEGGRDAATEFRVENGYAAAAEALCHACVTPRAEADLATTLAVTCRGDARAARRAFEAGCFVALRERLRDASERLARDASEAARLRGDRDARDRAAALCFAIAALRSRQRLDGLDPKSVSFAGDDGDKQDSSNTPLGVLLSTQGLSVDRKSDIAAQYVDLTRMLPPFADHRTRHARAAVAAFTATAKARPDTALAAERALRDRGRGRGDVRAPARLARPPGVPRADGRAGSRRHGSARRGHLRRRRRRSPRRRVPSPRAARRGRKTFVPRERRRRRRFRGARRFRGYRSFRCHQDPLGHRRWVFRV
jgi:hypothetical protein